MPLRFFADHCISTFMIDTLRDAEHEVLRLKDHLPVESPDSTVISEARELGAILLSLSTVILRILLRIPRPGTQVLLAFK